MDPAKELHKEFVLTHIVEKTPQELYQRIKLFHKNVVYFHTKMRQLRKEGDLIHLDQEIILMNDMIRDTIDHLQKIVLLYDAKYECLLHNIIFSE